MTYQSRFGSRQSPRRTSNFSSSSRPPRRQNGRQKKYIDPARFVQSARPQETVAYTPTHRFNDFALSPALQQNLREKGYDLPTPIQDQTIPVALKGQDVIGIASTGTGKTAAFALPVIQALTQNRSSHALIVAPTRELAEQIEQECKAFARGSGIGISLLIGGTNMGGQLRSLRTRPQLIIGTPGRIKDHLQRASLHLDTCNIIVLDEVDRMLDMGFVKDVTEILKSTKPQRQSLFFSATMDRRVQDLIQTFAQNPVTISLQTSTSSENVHQDVVRFQTSSDKLGKLHDILIKENVSKVIVFDETQRSVERLDKELRSRGFSTDSIHGGKTQGQRKRALAAFKNNDISILVATDVAARGIDVADISHVINYTTPNDYEDYIHRVGRAGRAGRVGYALTFIEQ